MKHLLFIYGDLKENKPQHDRLGGAVKVGTGYVTGNLYNCGGHPAITHGFGQVVGEFYVVDDKKLGELCTSRDTSQIGDMKMCLKEILGSLAGDTQHIRTKVLIAMILPANAKQVAGGVW